MHAVLVNTMQTQQETEAGRLREANPEALFSKNNREQQEREVLLRKGGLLLRSWNQIQGRKLR